MDGGVRGGPPDEVAPSVDSIIRASRNAQRREIWSEARGIDSMRPPQTNRTEGDLHE
jgi:hypothetical protein